MYSGAIIGDRDRKSWDPRAPIFLCKVDIGQFCYAYVMGSRVNGVTFHYQMVRVGRILLRIFHSDVVQGLRTRGLLCSFML